jgi:precorrin-2 dehydrogenase/sirohydrochlorin ferrochelatase
MTCYPIFLRVEGRPCVVIGGGRVGERKVLALLECGAQVTVVSPTLTPRLADLARAGRLRHEARPYARGDVAGCLLAFAATSDEALHERIARDADAAGVPLNVVDRPRHCSFFVPALLRRGDLAIAISTNGASPAMAKRVREQLERTFGAEYERVLGILRAVRRRLQRAAVPAQERRRILTALASTPLVDAVRTGEPSRIDQLLQATVDRDASLRTLGLPPP